MKKLGKIALAVALGLSMTACSSGTAKKDKSDVKIGVIQYTEHPALDKAYDGFVKQMKKAGYKKSQIDFKNAQNDQSNCETIANKFVNDGDDLIYEASKNILKMAGVKLTHYTGKTVKISNS